MALEEIQIQSQTEKETKFRGQIQIQNQMQLQIRIQIDRHISMQVLLLDVLLGCTVTPETTGWFLYFPLLLVLFVTSL